MNSSKRQFLRAAAGLSMAAGRGFNTPLAMGLAGIGALASQSAHGAGSDYRALVCLYMAGGNDSHNWLIPTDNASYSDYAASRPALALQQSSLLRLSSASAQPSGRQFGLCPELQPLHALYEEQRLAFVANVGTLLRPTTLSDYKSRSGLPPKLFSHNDQASTWQSFSPEGAQAGWGGRIGDLLMSGNGNPVFTAVSAAGSAVFLNGSSVVQYQLGPSGPVGIAGLESGSRSTPGTLAHALQKVLNEPGRTAFEGDYARVVRRSTESYAGLRDALAQTQVVALPSTAPTAGAMPLDQDPLARQFRSVARMIAAHQTLGMRRQVFLVSIGGFDTHANQLRDHGVLSARVAASSAWFMQAVAALGLSDNVTVFSASDFGRALASNGSGTDHGWGSHHFVAGGAVKGRNVYGRFPSTALGSSDDVGSGRLLPSTSVSEYAAPLGRWMGLSTSDLATVLPSLNAFSQANLTYI